MADMADALGHAGRSKESVDLFKKTMELNPFYPDQYLWYLGGTYYNLKQYQKAIDAVKKMNNPTEGCRVLAASYAQLGQNNLSKQYAKKYLNPIQIFHLNTGYQ